MAYYTSEGLKSEGYTGRAAFAPKCKNCQHQGNCPISDAECEERRKNAKADGRKARFAIQSRKFYSSWKTMTRAATAELAYQGSIAINESLNDSVRIHDSATGLTYFSAETFKQKLDDGKIS